MHSSFDTLFDEIAEPYLRQHLGETGSVIQFPQGDLTDPRDWTNSGIVFDEAEEPQRDRTHGIAVVRRPWILVPISITCYPTDQWKVGGVLFQVSRFEVPQGGSRRVWLKRVETSTSKQARDVI